MIIVSWNVNGLRAVLKNSGKSLKAFLDSLKADIICLQETKATRHQLDSSSCVADGYTSYFSFSKVKGGYSGVVTFCRSSATPVRAEEGLTGALTTARDGVGLTGKCPSHFSCKEEMLAFDGEGRAVLTEHMCDGGSADGECVREGGGREGGMSVVVINVYCPMVDRENVNVNRLEYKLLFYSVLQDRCMALAQAGKEVIVAGDLNCSREAIDSAYIQDTPTLLHGSPEREWMKTFAMSSLPPSLPTSSVLLDTFRYLHPSQTKAYTCWSTLLGYRKTNYGTRIDYILCSRGLVPPLSRAEVWAHVMGSDHCPVMADFSSLSLTPSPRPPSLSHGLQQRTLAAFIKPQEKDGREAISEVKGHKLDSTIAMGSSGVAVKGKKRKLSGGPSSTVKCHRTLRTFFTADQAMTTLSSSSRGGCSVSPPVCDPDTNLAGEPVSLPLEPSSSSTSSTTTFSSSTTTSSTSSTTTFSSSTTTSSTSSTTTFSSSTTTSTSSATSSTTSTSQLSSEWGSVFSGPPKPPLCKRHSEPATLRTVRKTGPNRGRQFWACPRPGGSKTDPNTQCDFFQWLTPARGKHKVT